MNTVKELTIVSDSWATTHNIPNADTLMNGQYTITVRKIGEGRESVYERLTTRTIPNPNGSIENVIAELLTIASVMKETTITTFNKAIGGGHGHYDYGVVTEVTGWVTLTKDEVTAMRKLQEVEKIRNRNIREAKKLEREAAKLRNKKVVA